MKHTETYLVFKIHLQKTFLLSSNVCCKHFIRTSAKNRLNAVIVSPYIEDTFNVKEIGKLCIASNQGVEYSQFLQSVRSNFIKL